MRGRVVSDGSVDPSRRHDYWGVVLEAPDPPILGRFYADLLGWPMTTDDSDGATLKPEDGVAYLAIQKAAVYTPPVWPPTEGTQHMTMHLDFEVTDLDDAVAHAVELGASVADHQPQDDVRVLLDPAGHPLCLYVGS